MFSPDASARTNTRRRQRKDSDGHQQPRRKRNKLSEDKPSAFTNGDAHLNGSGSATPNGHDASTEDAGAGEVRHMVVRGKQSPTKRQAKEDVSHYLVGSLETLPAYLLTRPLLQTKNESYSVRKLPSVPAALTQGTSP